MQYKEQKKDSGFALLLALIISSVVLAIGVSILHISVNQINLSATARESEFAFQASHAGIDCQWYWRNEKAAEYLMSGSGSSNPDVTCFGQNPIDTGRQIVAPTSGTGNGDAFFNMFQWGSPARCTIVGMYILQPTTDMTVLFQNKGIGTDGLKSCSAGNVCTVIVSDGYNRGCGEIDGSIFSVQREITVEF